jgi:hypothetical protein
VRFFLVSYAMTQAQLRINCQLVLRLFSSPAHALFFLLQIAPFFFHVQRQTAESNVTYANVSHFFAIENSKEIVKTSSDINERRARRDFGHRIELDFSNLKEREKEKNTFKSQQSRFSQFSTSCDFFLNFQTCLLAVFLSLTHILRSRARASSTNYQAQNCYTITAIEAADRLNNRRLVLNAFI